MCESKNAVDPAALKGFATYCEYLCFYFTLFIVTTAKLNTLK